MGNITGRKFAGRTKGTPNKGTAEIRKSFQMLIENNIKTLESDLKKLEPRDRIKLILDLSRFVLPTLKATELTLEKEEDHTKKVTINFTKKR